MCKKQRLPTVIDFLKCKCTFLVATLLFCHAVFTVKCFLLIKSQLDENVLSKTHGKKCSLQIFWVCIM